jgi:hypothetical protein
MFRSIEFVKFAAWKNGLENDIFIVVDNKWHNVNVSFDWEEKDILSFPHRVFENSDVFLLYDQFGNTLEGNTPFGD